MAQHHESRSLSATALATSFQFRRSGVMAPLTIDMTMALQCSRFRFSGTLDFSGVGSQGPGSYKACLRPALI